MPTSTPTLLALAGSVAAGVAAGIAFAAVGGLCLWLGLSYLARDRAIGRWPRRRRRYPRDPFHPGHHISLHREWQAPRRQQARTELRTRDAAAVKQIIDHEPGHEPQVDTGWVLSREPDDAGVRRRKKAFAFTPNVSRSGTRVV